MNEASRLTELRRLFTREQQGLEIGPSHFPIAPKAEGYNIHILDHLDQAGLKAKYATHGVDASRIEAVDFVWTGGSYLDAVPGRACYDYIIASHVIEHATDLIGFIGDCEALLKPEGALILCVPDKRYCFDRFRQPSSLAHVIDRHLKPWPVHSPGTAAEYCLTVVSRGGTTSWPKTSKGEFAFVHNGDLARRLYDGILKQGHYHDMHAWCFTPTHFRLLVDDLREMALVHSHVHDCRPLRDHEFLAVLKRQPAPAGDRMALLRQSLTEQLEGLA